MTLNTVNNELYSCQPESSQCHGQTLGLEQQKNPDQAIKRKAVKQELQNRIESALLIAKDLPPEDCLHTIRQHLITIQAYCKSIGKSFIFVEEAIACDEYDLQGAPDDSAILFRGPDEQASVAICVTCKGSLTHRNESAWAIYSNAGDIGVDCPV